MFLAAGAAAGAAAAATAAAAAAAAAAGAAATAVGHQCISSQRADNAELWRVSLLLN